MTLLDKISNSGHGFGRTFPPHWGPIWTPSAGESARSWRGRSADILGNSCGNGCSSYEMRSCGSSPPPWPSSLAPEVGLGGASAQSGTPAPDQGKAAAQPADAADAAQKPAPDRRVRRSSPAINGPAGNPECVWLGRRVVRLMWRDDLDTAFRHLDLYDRFGCPGGHIQAAFRCLTRFGGQIDPKVAETPEQPRARLLDQPGSPAAAASRAAQPAAPTTGNSQAPQPAASPAPAASPTPRAPEIAAIVSAAVQERSAIERWHCRAFRTVHALIRS